MKSSKIVLNWHNPLYLWVCAAVNSPAPGVRVSQFHANQPVCLYTSVKGKYLDMFTVKVDAENAHFTVHYQWVYSADGRRVS